MTDPHAAAAPADAHAAHPPVNYVKIWAILCVLLCVSVVGPMVGIRWLTLMTAFGIALVKAYMVAKNFMHLHIERRFVVYMLVAMLGIMGLFFAGISPDVMHHEGQRWVNTAANEAVERGMKAAPEEHEEKQEK